MSCERWELRIADGERGADRDQHLAGCSDCRALAFDLRENAAALSAMRDDPLPTRPRRWPYVAAALAAAAMLTIALWPHAEAPAPIKVVAIDTPGPIPKAPQPPPTPAAPKPKPKPKPAEPMLVKMLTDDPDVVIYWLIDNEGE